MQPIIVDRLTKRFGPVLAVDDLSFEVAAGRVTGFLGPNGSGKTTTLSALVALVEPTSGDTRVNGVHYRQLDDPVRTVGVAIDANCFHPGRSARSHLSWITTAAGIDAGRADMVLDLVGLQDDAGRKVGGYSLGMRQRLLLAQALLGDPRILVLDEPLNGLDPAGIAWMRTFLRGFAANGGTVLLSSHLLAEVDQTVDDVVVIGHGRLLAAGPLDELRPEPVTVLRTPDAATFFPALVAEGFDAIRTGPETVEITGSSAEAVGRSAAASGAIVTGLVERRDGLEQVFQQLTEAVEVPA
jgi:ABC-2 type transport system ATP-binding protein